jgi:D-alanine-D-alanine ligase-like ATP-grasp enzyme
MAERICLLTDQELDDLPLPDDDWPCDPRPFLPEAEWTLLTLEKETCVGEVVRAAREGYDLFFNLCDGAWDEGRVGIEVVQTLQSLDVAFTGADSAFFEPSREIMKRVCRAWDVDTPAYAIAYTERDIEKAADTLRFPLFVKHPSSYASNGITQDSRVDTVEGLRGQAGIMMRGFGAALIEEFIEGIEFTVLVAEGSDPADPVVYRPIQYRFPEGETFKHHDLKWVDYDGLTAFPVEDPALDLLLREASSRFFQGMRGAGYGRCDIRVDSDGCAYMLEVNPNCGIYYPETDPGSADLILLNDPSGHAGFTRQVVEAAQARHRRRRKSWQVLPRPGGSYGVFSTRPIDEGQTVIAWEGQPHHLVTTEHVDAAWDERRRLWFERWAWPLSEDVWVTWSEDPEEWRPVNHSCDPNAWLTGLDLVARRLIAEGEEITLDYATIFDERKPPFPCACGSPECRGIIRGDDFLRDFAARYEGHMSSHIARRRAAAITV